MNLREMLRPPLVAVDVRVKDWQEAVHVCGRLFNVEGATEERFSEAMIRVATEFGPYIVVAPGIALPHARPEDGVIRASMSVIKLSTPVNFGNAENDPVWLVVALAAIDNRQHLQGLVELATVLSDPLNIDRLKACQTPEELLEVFYSIPVGG
jgi:mannitol/fructose-specific phosphotransferase system IIA component (Ntr-type)